MPLLIKLIVAVIVLTAVAGGGYFLYKSINVSPNVSVDILNPSVGFDKIKMDIPDVSGKKIGEVAWVGGSESLPEPFGTSILIFKPSQVAGTTKLDKPFMRSVSFMSDAEPAAVSDFYKNNLPKNGWVAEVVPANNKAVHSIMKFKKESVGLTETLSVVVYSTTSNGKMIFSITYSKTEKQ